MPGEELARQVLTADLLSVLQLILAVLVFVILFLAAALVAMMYWNGKAASTSSTTQQNLSAAMVRHLESDAKKTEALQASVEEQKLMREAYEKHQTGQQQAIDNATIAVKLHDERSEKNATAILDRLTDITNLLGTAVTDVNEATAKQTEPILAAIIDLKTAATAIPETIQATYERQMGALKKQQEDQQDLLKSQYEEQMRIVNKALDMAVRRVITSINLRQGSLGNEENTPSDPVPAGDAEPVLVASDVVSPGQPGIVN